MIMTTTTAITVMAMTMKRMSLGFDDVNHFSIYGDSHYNEGHVENIISD